VTETHPETEAPPWQEAAPNGNTRDGARGRGEFLVWAATFFAIVVGVEVRLLPLFWSEFPPNDGGLLTVLISDLHQSSFDPPPYSSYNDGTIPFFQPPLPLVLAAVVTQAGLLDTTTALRILPTGFSLFTLLAFWSLARTLLVSQTAVAVAFVSYALLPAAYQHLIMGGGLTRAPGTLLALLTLSQATILLRQGTLPRVILVGTLGAMAFLCDLGSGWFLALMLSGLAVARGDRATAKQDLALAALGTLALAAPWWADVILTHGVGPLLNPWWSGPVAFTALRLPLPFNALAFAGVLGSIGLAAWLVNRGGRLGLVLGWLLGLGLLDSAVALHSAPIVALGLGLLVGDHLLPRLIALGRPASSETDRIDNPPITQGPDAHRALPRDGQWSELAALRLIGTDTVAFLVLVGFMGHAYVAPWRTEQAGLQALSETERIAIRGAGNSSALSAKFLVISGDPHSLDRTGEWFPALAGRVNIVSPQALPWGPGGDFASRIEAHTWAQACGRQGAACLDQWQQDSRVTFSHVYVVRRPDRSCCDPLRAALRADERYRVVYDGPGATVFVRSAEGSG
jgi:hypothetical protein